MHESVDDLYLHNILRMSREGTVDRCGYGGHKEVLLGTVSIDLKHTEASFSPSSIDLLCLQVA